MQTKTVKQRQSNKDSQTNNTVKEKHIVEKNIVNKIIYIGKAIDNKCMVIVPKPCFLLGIVIAHCENATMLDGNNSERRQLSNV